MLLACTQPAIAAPTPGDEIASAWGLYFQGKALTARSRLAAALDRPETKDPAPRLAVLRALLDMCVEGEADACVLQYAKDYVETENPPAKAASLQDRERLRLYDYYLNQARMALRSLEATRLVADDELWKHENAYNGALYLKRQALLADADITLDDYDGAGRAVDKTLSLVAALQNPQDSRLAVAEALAKAVAALDDAGQGERAFGVYKAAGDFIFKTLPPLTLEAARFRLTEARLLEERGDFQGAGRSIDLAAAVARVIELDDDVRQDVLSDALTMKAAVCAGRLDLDCAHAALDQHPLADRFSKSGRRPATYGETTYLAVRALVNAFSQGDDPGAAAALAQPLDVKFNDTTNSALEVYRVMGAALAQPPGEARARGLLAAGQRIEAAVKGFPTAGFGGWYRPGALDQVLIGLVLTQAGAGGSDADETIFALMQLAGRQGATLDADALTALGQARDAMQRRSIHQALRLRARRDELERDELTKVVAMAANTAPTGRALRYDVTTRGAFRDFASRISAADADLVRADVSTSGANITPLKALQAVLGPNEAALTAAPVAGGLAYMCVRRDGILRKAAPADLRQTGLDIRLLQSALTADYAPNEALDSQFPVAAATRLYDVLIRPFDGCLKPGDHILWLPNASITGVPLAALLEHAPPKLGQGYDLAGAAWLVADHSISYAGSASAIVAARSAAARAPADFDFLGVGDPVLSGTTEGGEDRAKIVRRGVRGGASLAALAPLPETRLELEASAKGFAAAKILTGQAATEHDVRGQLVGAYRYLSFATHGLLRDDLQGLAEPALALTPVSSADPTNDGLFTASEIADLNLTARFVALSACNTANFDLSQMSRDLPALASAFAVAGVPATLGTLWAVDSTTGEAVVSGLFANLRQGSSPADALARAQRAFLAAPPGRAYLHPRFWTPFIVLGDGGIAPRAPDPAEPVVTADLLTNAGGDSEVLTLRRDGGRVLAGFIGPADAKGRQGAAVRMAGADGREIWRRQDGEARAGRVLLELGGKVVIGAQAAGPEGRAVPALLAFDGKSGRPAGAWRGEGRADRNIFMAAGANLDADHAVVVTVEAPAGHVALHVMSLDAKLKPQPMFDVTPPAAFLDEATITPVGPNLILTYTERYPPPDQPVLLGEDDFDQPLCRRPPITWVELREAASGTLIASRRLDGWMAASVALQDGAILLGGGVQPSCTAELKAAVARLDADLAPAPVWTDASPGTSEVRALAALGDGSTFVAARKANVLDYAPLEARAKAEAQGAAPSTTYSGMLLTLDATGRVKAEKMLDSGGDLFVFSAEAGDPGDILVGGALGGEAAIFHLTAR
ncbi:CHAT domain-containing protein [Phenylobacterium sp.]|uniref:CHAT domain-containing protein n=1 Tax=Phenylobacterium sp. TaxID=1871053 RepID=UPI0035B17231